MNIREGKIVKMNYVLRAEDGEELDRSESDAPFEYLQGGDQIVPGLEKALEGLKRGDKKTVVVGPEEGYGAVNENLVAQVKKTMFPQGMPIEVGLQFRANLETGPAVLTIEAIDGDTITVNGNHPLAGETLHFDIEILDVRDATPEELEHGHAHGPDGHHH